MKTLVTYDKNSWGDVVRWLDRRTPVTSYKKNSVVNIDLKTGGSIDIVPKDILLQGYVCHELVLIGAFVTTDLDKIKRFVTII